MKFKLTLLITQPNEKDWEEHDVEAEFIDAVHLAEQLAKFAAMQSKVRTHPKVRSFCAGVTIPFPPTKEGYGPDTYVVIKKIEQIL